MKRHIKAIGITLLVLVIIAIYAAGCVWLVDVNPWLSAVWLFGPVVVAMYAKIYEDIKK